MLFATLKINPEITPIMLKMFSRHSRNDPLETLNAAYQQGSNVSAALLH